MSRSEVWVVFAQAALRHLEYDSPDITVFMACERADKMMAEYEKRFPEVKPSPWSTEKIG